MANAYPRESAEFVPVNVTRDGVPVTTGVSLAVVTDGFRPETFLAADIVAGKPGLFISALGPGTYRIFAQLAAPPETPVIDCGYFYIE